MKRVLLDVDGVLADFLGAVLPLINARCNTRFTHDDVTDFDFCRALGLSDAQSAAVIRDIGNARGIARTLAVCAGAVEGHTRLHRAADVYIVTSPWNGNATWTSDREWWLRQHFGIHSSCVIHARAKHVCSGDFLVDDNTDICREWQACNPRSIAVQWRTPSNRLDGWQGLSTNSWSDLIALVAERSP